MTISKTMEKAIKEKDVRKIYSSFYTIALSDPGFCTNKFEKTLEYIVKLNIPNFLQKYSGELLQDERNWNEDYWGYLLSELMDNFCMERVQQLKRVGRKVYVRKEEKGTESQAKIDKKSTSINTDKSPNNALGSSFNCNANRTAAQNRNQGRENNRKLYDKVRGLFK